MIGFIDSGVGGMSVWRETVKLLPNVSTIYIADRAHCPYGEKPFSDILRFSRQNTLKLLEMGVKIVVLACNTATAAAVDTLRKEFQEVQFVGMEPAIKPAAAKTRSGVVAVLATSGTFKGRLWRETCQKYAGNVEVLKIAAPEFVQIVESGQLDTANAIDAIRSKIAPALAAGADKIVLGCTHFPFLKKQIAAEAGAGVEIIDPSPAVARQISRIWKSLGEEPESAPVHKFIYTRPIRPAMA